MFAAVNTVEPPIVELEAALILERDKPWFEERRRDIERRVRGRLSDLSKRLGSSPWLDGAFSAGDLLMVHVLRRLEGTGIVDAFPTLAAYVDRAEARPVYKRAFEAQRAVYTDRQSPNPKRR